MEERKGDVKASANTVKVVGMGMSPDDLSMKARSIINEADVLIGGKGTSPVSAICRQRKSACKKTCRESHR